MTNLIGTKIPTLFPHNHASNLLVLENGDLLCTWFAGSREGKADISVLLSRLKAGEVEWGTPVVLSEDAERSEQNPILYKNADGKLWLLYTAQIGIHQDTAIVRYRVSEDDGLSWGPVDTLFDAQGIFVRNPPLISKQGEVLLPAYYCLKSDTGFLGDDHSVMKISRDHGATWTEYPIPKSEGLVHMSLVETEDGLAGFFRSRKADNIYVTRSVDGGKTWSTPEKTALMNNNASVQCTRLQSGNHVMIFNNVNADIAYPEENRPPWFDRADMDAVKPKNVEKPSSIWGVIRAPLTLALSEDGGKTWPYVKNLITKDGYEGKPEFSYPSIKQAEDGTIHITYTYLRENINHTTISEQWLKNI